MLHNFWLTANSLPKPRCIYSEFNADFDKKKVQNLHFFGWFAHFKVFDFFPSISREFHEFQILKSPFLGQFLTLKNMVEFFSKFELFEFFRNQVWDKQISGTSLEVTLIKLKIKLKIFVQDLLHWFMNSLILVHIQETVFIQSECSN